MVFQPCVECGNLSDKNRCVTHRLKSSPKFKRSHAADFNRSKWRRFSRKLRAMAPHCEMCGTDVDLTVDHIVRVIDRPEWTYEVDNCRILCRTHNGSISGTPATPEVEATIAAKISESKARRLRRRGDMHRAPITDRPLDKSSFPSHIVDKVVSRGD